MQEEIWKDAKVLKNGELFDFTGLYEASNLGRIRNAKTGRILKPFDDGRGYMLIDLERKQFRVHRIIATTFLINDNPNEKTVVNHKDENPLNNCVDNLEWCTQEYNLNYGTCQERRSEKRKGKPLSEEAKCKISEKLKGKKPVNIRKILCVETGQIFNSIKEAKEWLGKGDIKSNLRGKTKSGGKHPKTGEKLHWQYVD